MKKIIVLLVLLYTIGNISAQPPRSFTYQSFIKDSDGNNILSEEVNIVVNILSGSESGSSVFSETHVVTTTNNGFATILIGSIEDLSSITWSSDVFFLKIEVNGVLQENKQLLSSVYAFHAKDAALAKSIDYTQIIDAPNPSVWDTNSSDDFDGLYSSLVINKWKGINNNLYYNNGKVALSNTTSEIIGSEVLKVNGAVLYNGGPTDTIPGVLYYDPAGDGSFRYFDNNKELQVIGSGTITYTNNDPTASDVVIMPAYPSGVEWANRVCVGSGAKAGYNFGENIFVVAADTVRVYFYDTSNSASFPSHDYQLQFNDLELNGENYFAIYNLEYTLTPFKLMGNAPSNSLYLSENGYVGVGLDEAIEQLEVSGSVKASTYIGNAINLNDLNGDATDQIVNTGSTTVAADSNADTNGSIDFQTKNISRMKVSSNGYIKNGAGEPSCLFDAAETVAQVTDLEVDQSLKVNAVEWGVYNENNPASDQLIYDVLDKKIILFDSAIGAITINGFQNGVAGQEVTIINTSATGTITIRYWFGGQSIQNPLNASITLNQYQSVTYIFDSGIWKCKSLAL